MVEIGRKYRKDVRTASLPTLSIRRWTGQPFTLLSSNMQSAEVARLSQLSSRTLSLVLERQRLASFSPGGTLPTSQLTQITRNLTQLRDGILEQEESFGYEAVDPLKQVRQQWSRMRAMLGEDGLSIDRCVACGAGLRTRTDTFARYIHSLPPAPSPPPPPKSPLLTTYSGGDRIDTPYTDDPEYDDGPADDTPYDPHEMIGLQQQMMTGQ